MGFGAFYSHSRNYTKGNWSGYIIKRGVRQHSFSDSWYPQLSILKKDGVLIYVKYLVPTDRIHFLGAEIFRGTRVFYPRYGGPVCFSNKCINSSFFFTLGVFRGFLFINGGRSGQKVGRARTDATGFNGARKKILVWIKFWSYKWILREASLFMGWGTGNDGNRYNSRKSPYFRLIFKSIFIEPLGFQNNWRSKIFRPLPFETRPKIFAPPKTKKMKNEKCPQYPKYTRKSCFRTIEKIDQA